MMSGGQGQLLTTGGTSVNLRTYVCMLYLQELIITGVPAMVPGVMVDVNTININGNNVTLTLSWGEPFNNLDPIVNYTVLCSGDVACPPNFTTIDNTTRSYDITNLTPMTNYTFAVLATNSIGSGEAGVVMVTAPMSNMRVNITSSTSTSNSITTTARPSKSMITTSTPSIIIISTVIPTVISTNASTPSTSTSTRTSSMDMTEGITITSKFYYCYNFKLGRCQPHIGICLIS